MHVLNEAHHAGIAVQSNMARNMAAEVAAAATLGLISTALQGGYCRRWRLTARGLTYLEREQ
jgi:Na+/glutamate symporter